MKTERTETMNNNNDVLSHITSVPDILTEQELIEFLRIHEVSTASDYHTVVNNLIRFRNLPRIQICKKLLFPKKAVLEWVEKETVKNIC